MPRDQGSPLKAPGTPRSGNSQAPPFATYRSPFELRVVAPSDSTRHAFQRQLEAVDRTPLGGADLRSVQTLLGHKDISMTMRYAHLSAAHLREAISVLGSTRPRAKKDQSAEGGNS
jgi:Phage integrase family